MRIIAIAEITDLTLNIATVIILTLSNLFLLWGVVYGNANVLTTLSRPNHSSVAQLAEQPAVNR